MNLKNLNQPIEGPSLFYRRYLHTCSTLKFKEKQFIVVIGGYSSGGHYVLSTEIWDPTSEDGWIEGIGDISGF